MAKIMSSDCVFSGGNCGFGCSNLENLGPVMVKMPIWSKLGSSLTVRSSDDGGFFSRSLTLKSQERRVCTHRANASDAKMYISIGKSLRWWEKGVQPNMKEIRGAEDLVESLLTTGDKLVVVDFFSPGCGGCKALHPKLCQLAEMNPDVQFLQVNYEEHKSMCYSLHIKKFKDALAKHKPERCSLGLPKGLEEKELVALGANPDLSFVYNPKPEHPQKEVAPPPLPPVPAVAVSNSLSESSLPLPVPLKSTLEMKEDNKSKTLLSSGR